MGHDHVARWKSSANTTSEGAAKQGKVELISEYTYRKGPD